MVEGLKSIFRLSTSLKLHGTNQSVIQQKLPHDIVLDAKFGQGLPSLDKTHFSLHEGKVGNIVKGLQDSCGQLK